MLNCQSNAPWSVVLDGLDHVMKMSAKRKRPTVVNLSLGGGYQRSVNNAVQKLSEAGVVVVVAAGNDAGNACLTTPASSSYAITVGGTDKSNILYTSSNIGPCVDIFAPGVFIQGAHYKCSDRSVEYPDEVREDACTYVLSGTSMASPLAGGVVAGFLEEWPLMRPGEAKTLIKEKGRRGAIKRLRVGSPNLFISTNGKPTYTLNYSMTSFFYSALFLLGSCGGYYPFRVQLGLSSPGYPTSYPRSLRCHWTIPAAYNEDVGVVISDLDLERGYDYLYLCQEDNCTSYTGKRGRGGSRLLLLHTLCR